MVAKSYFFGSFFGDRFWREMEPKMVPKWSPKLSEINIKLCSVLGIVFPSIFHGFWEAPGSENLVNRMVGVVETEEIGYSEN